jgi:hypothetical protein
MGGYHVSASNPDRAEMLRAHAEMMNEYRDVSPHSRSSGTQEANWMLPDIADESHGGSLLRGFRVIP